MRMKVLQFQLPQGQRAGHAYHSIREQIGRCCDRLCIAYQITMPQHYQFTVKVQDRDYLVLCLAWPYSRTTWRLIGD